MKKHLLTRRIALSLGAFAALVASLTVMANMAVGRYAEGRIFTDGNTAPHRRVTLMLGTNPIGRTGRPNSYFNTRIATAAAIYRAGKTDYIIASGDNHTAGYDEPTAMRDSLWHLASRPSGYFSISQDSEPWTRWCAPKRCSAATHCS